jgi:prevent-host-death family protein
MVNYCAIVIMENQAMEEIAISKFKATCLAVLERVRRTGEPILVTRFGKPIAEVKPAYEAKLQLRRLGTLSSTIEIHGDIVGPISDISEWEAAREPEKE